MAVHPRVHHCYLKANGDWKGGASAPKTPPPPPESATAACIATGSTHYTITLLFIQK